MTGRAVLGQSCLLVGWLLHVPATVVCISGTDLLRQFHVLPHSDCLSVACLTSQQQASVSQGRICSDNFTCCHTEIEVADQTFYLTQSQYTDTGPTSPSADPRTPGAWQGSHWSANFEVTGMTRPRKNPVARGIRTAIFRSRGGRLTTRPTRRSGGGVERGGGGGVRTHANSKEKIPSTGFFSPEEDRTRDAASSRTASPTHTTNELFQPQR